MASTYVASNAEAYELSMGRWSRRLARPFVSFAELDGVRRIVDVGCGTGALTAALPAAGEAVGVDIGEVFRARQYASPLAEAGGLAAAFRRHGLGAIEETSLTIRMEFARFDDLWAPWLAGQGVIGAYVAGLPASERAVLGDAMRRAYLAGGGDGPRSFAASAWAVRARA